MGYVLMFKDAGEEVKPIRKIIKYEVKRGNKRFVVFPLQCVTRPSSLGRCVLKNVSIRGAFFLNRSPPPVGSQVIIEFIEEPLLGYEIEGQVIRHGSGLLQGFAVLFSEPHPKLLRAVYH